MEICKLHLKGKCIAGKDCTRKHNPPCRFFQRGECKKGKDCVFPHHQSNAAAAKGDDDESEASNDEKGNNNQGQRRGRSKSRGNKRSQTPGPATVCVPRPRVTGSCSSSPVAVASGADGPRSCLSDHSKRRAIKPKRSIKFGKTEFYDRPVTVEMIHFAGAEQRDPNYQHNPRKMDPEISAQCAIDRAVDLIEEIADDERDDDARNEPPPRDMPKASGKVLPIGRREWIIDSGSSFDIMFPYDLSKTEKKKV